METHELRLTLSRNEAEQMHLAIYATDAAGQWQLVDDWTCDDRQERQEAMAMLSDDVNAWLTFGGSLLPA
jgi:hypothetical protein